MNQITRLLRDIPFRRKITLICILISLIPLLLLGTFGCCQISHQLRERERAVLQETLRQEADIINNKLSLYQNALDTVVWDEYLKNELLLTYDTSYDMYMFYKGNVDPRFLTIRSLNKGISKLTLYTQAAINPHGENVRSLDSAQDMPWYNQALNSYLPFYSVSGDGQTLYLTAQMFYRFDAPVSVVCLAVDIHQMMESAETLLDSGYGLLLVDQDGAVIYDNTTVQETPFSGSISAEQICSGDIPSLYEMEHYFVEDAGWTVYLYHSLDGLGAANRSFAATVALLICICIALSLLIASSLSKIVVAPLEKLSTDMAEVENGNYQIDLPDDLQQDEVGHLVQAFHVMVTRLNYYVNKVLVATIDRQKYELRILQAQINPHFLYNSLSLINSRAIMTGQSEISQMALQLSTFYRTMLNKGKAITTVRAELENTKSYISIQRIMHSNSFDVVYDIAEDVLEYPVLNLIIQPLAENAILHGLDHSETPGQNILTIVCYTEGDDVIFKVIDNGCGMSEEECRTILTAESTGYGVKNVHQRIQLYYGSNYGLQYRSTPGFGTCATMRIAKKLETV